MYLTINERELVNNLMNEVVILHKTEVEQLEFTIRALESKLVINKLIDSETKHLVNVCASIIRRINNAT